jgi:hypothetical protein
MLIRYRSKVLEKVEVACVRACARILRARMRAGATVSSVHPIRGVVAIMTRRSRSSPPEALRRSIDFLFYSS